MRKPGDTFPGGVDGPHEGHTITVIATDVPGAREYGIPTHTVRFVDEVWVECSCGERWGYVDPDADEAAKDGDGWPE